MPDHLWDNFSEKFDLIEQETQGYAGTPIRSQAGQVIGILWVLSTRPLQQSLPWADVIKIFAAKAGVELERLRAEDQLQHTVSLLRSSLESTTDGILVVDNDGRTTNYNKRFAEMWGLPDDLLASRNDDRMLRHVTKLVKNPDQFLSKVRALYSQPDAISEDEIEFNDGRIFERHSQPQKIGDQTVGRVWSFRDVTENRRASEFIERQATHDILTDLPNRRLLMDRLEQALARCRRHGHFGAALFIDLDNFKKINDSLGHAAGDALLIQVANRLRRLLREEDTLARLGGDEFMVLFPEVSNEREPGAQKVQLKAGQIRKTLLESYLIDGHEQLITSSVGIAMFPMGDELASDVVRHADTAMYRAKRAGKDATQFFLPSMQQAVEQRLQLESDLRKAVEKDELYMHYQPQVDHQGNIIGAEALLRWQSESQGLISPEQFIAVAEETGQILGVGRFVFECAFKQLKHWMEINPDPAFKNLAVNVSPRQFHREDFVDQFERILGETGANPHYITLELTEGVLIESLEEAIHKMGILKDLGLRLSIDDFGTGYSSLTYLKRMPLDEIKIDRSFVQDISTDSNNANLVEVIISLADQLKLDVVAEGVETAAQLEFLSQRGCRRFQGYYFGQPMDAGNLTRLIGGTLPAAAAH